jgi:thymidylate synthase (FAD)
MKGIEVQLVDSMGGDLSISNSARVSFDKWKETMDEKDAKLINYLGEHQHMTPFRHNCVQVRCVSPIFLARQLMKHQAGLTWNEVSRRYVDDGIEMFYPEGWRARPDKSIKQGSGGGNIEWVDRTMRTHTVYLKAINQAVETYMQMIEAGVAPEMARMVLPQSMLTSWIWTGNLLAFAHIYNLRIKENSQLEAQVFAEKLGNIIKEQFPVGWEALTGDK